MYRAKWFGGRLVFQSYNLEADLMEVIRETDPTPVMLVNEKLEKVSRWASRRFKQYTGVDVLAETFKKEIIKKIKEIS